MKEPPAHISSSEACIKKIKLPIKLPEEAKIGTHEGRLVRTDFRSNRARPGDVTLYFALQFSYSIQPQLHDECGSQIYQCMMREQVSCVPQLAPVCLRNQHASQRIPRTTFDRVREVQIQEDQGV